MTIAKIIYSTDGRQVIIGGTEIPVWVKYTVTAAQLSAAATTSSITLLSLPAGGVIHGVKIKHSAAFTGGLLSAYTVSVGILGNLAKYASAYNVFQAAAVDNWQITEVLGGEDQASAVNILVTAVSVGANVSAAAAGSVDIWVLRSTLV
jgi:hypothetical protein